LASKKCMEHIRLLETLNDHNYVL